MNQELEVIQTMLELDAKKHPALPLALNVYEKTLFEVNALLLKQRDIMQNDENLSSDKAVAQLDDQIADACSDALERLAVISEIA